MWFRVVPFALYMGFVALNDGIQWWLPDEAGEWLLWLYPLKIAAVGTVLMMWWERYTELREPLIRGWREVVATVAVGMGVYVLWVKMDWSWAVQGEMNAYNPFLAGETRGMVLAGIRFVGAVMIVPIMEELFWRSFLLRWLINPQFERVPLGTFSPFSFMGTVVLFGLEHHLWAAGMMAGVAYNVVLYYTRRLWPCILAHALTNGALGIHVMMTNEWIWW